MTSEADKNAAAVMLGRLGGRVGGKARAAKMTPEQRSEAARRAALGRWGAKPEAARAPSEPVSGEPRTRILTIAAAQFAELGYSAVSMRDLARRAGVGLPTIYGQFGDKKGLYLAAWLHALELYTAMLSEAVEGLPPGRLAIYAFCRMICRINTDPARPRLLQNQRLSADDPIFARIAERIFTEQFGVLRASVAILAGEAEADTKTYLVYALSHGLAQLAPLAQNATLDLPGAYDHDAMALRALSTVFPDQDWAVVRASAAPL